MRISDWSSDVCSSDLGGQHRETRGEIEAHLRAEYRQRADPGAVVLPRAGIEDSLHQIEILVHPKRLAACRVPAKPVVQCRRPFGLSATAAATGRDRKSTRLNSSH